MSGRMIENYILCRRKKGEKEGGVGNRWTKLT